MVYKYPYYVSSNFQMFDHLKKVQTDKFKHVPQLYSHSNNEGHSKFLTLKSQI